MNETETWAVLIGGVTAFVVAVVRLLFWPPLGYRRAAPEAPEPKKSDPGDFDPYAIRRLADDWDRSEAARRNWARLRLELRMLPLLLPGCSVRLIGYDLESEVPPVRTPALSIRFPPGQMPAPDQLEVVRNRLPDAIPVLFELVNCPLPARTGAEQLEAFLIGPAAAETDPFGPVQVVPFNEAGLRYIADAVRRLGRSQPVKGQ